MPVSQAVMNDINAFARQVVIDRRDSSNFDEIPVAEG